ncbi:MAG: hypothetical protein AB8G22_28480 [Saprospiraceae bacterium]
MKKYLFLFVLAFALYSCQDKANSTATAPTENVTTTPTENVPANTSQQVQTATDRPVEYEPEKFDNAIGNIDWSKGLKNRRWGIAGRQYQFKNVGNGKYMEAALVEVKPDSPTEEFLNLSQIIEVRRDETIGGWRGRYQIFESPGRYVCTLTPATDGLIVTVNTPQGERAATWQLLKEL